MRDVPRNAFVSFERVSNGTRIGSMTITADGEYELRLRKEYAFNWSHRPDRGILSGRRGEYMACGRDQPGRPLRRYGHRNEAGGGQLTTCGIEAAVSLRRAALPVPHAWTAARLRTCRRFGAFCGIGRIRRMGFLSVVSVCAACLAVAGCASIAGSPLRAGGETELSDGVGFRLPDIPDTLRGSRTGRVSCAPLLGRFRFRRRGYRCSGGRAGIRGFPRTAVPYRLGGRCIRCAFRARGGFRRVVPSNGAVRQVPLRTLVADAQR